MTSTRRERMGVCRLVWPLAVVLCAAATARAADPAANKKVSLLWPQGAPGAKGMADGDKPSLTIYAAAKDKANGAAVVICPGGGYGHLAMGHEGHEVARWLNAHGISAFILMYRHRRSGAGYGHPAPMNDAQRAIRTVRSRAAQWGVDPKRIGILGFSAGGHLASTAATRFDKGKSDATDPIDRVSCRPDFAVLVYPVISLVEPFTHRGSRNNLLGTNPNPKLVESLSNERQVTAQTPPTFLVHTYGDRGVPAENSVYFYLACRKAKVPVEMHLYEQGPHGFGLGRKPLPAASWPERCIDWMKARKLLEKK